MPLADVDHPDAKAFEQARPVVLKL